MSISSKTVSVIGNLEGRCNANTSVTNPVTDTGEKLVIRFLSNLETELQGKSCMRPDPKTKEKENHLNPDAAFHNLKASNAASGFK